MQLSNRRIVLTGGTSGIGRELAVALARDSAVVVLARRSERSDNLQTELPDIELLDIDLSCLNDIAAAAEALVSGGPIHGLINCAAVQFTPVFTSPDFDLASIRREIDINLVAPCELTALLLPSLLQVDEAFIMNVNSGLGLVPKSESAVYCATKGGLNIFTKALRNQLHGSAVRVQQTFLPLVDTPMTQGRGQGKLAAREVARRILVGIERGTEDIYVGKVNLLRAIERLAPPLARRIMVRA